jgi:nucleoporin POM34
MSNSPGSSYSASPSSRRNSLAGGSPFGNSPSASPLLHKATKAGRRSSHGTVSTAVSAKRGLDSTNPSTPSPGGKVSVGLNNKWLYEKGRSNPGSIGIFS